MRITKHEHAALRVEDGGKTLIVDPGGFTAPLADLDDVVAVVITHQHPDHWTQAHIDAIREAAGDVPVFGPAGVAALLDGVTVVQPGESISVEPFTLQFFGGTHAVIHESIPVVDNVGVLVNDTLYYPGDSYAEPGVEVPVLAAPIGAPWLKVGDAMDFVLAVRPRIAFGTHDGTLSARGLAMHRDRLEWATSQNAGVFHRLDAGDTLDV